MKNIDFSGGVNTRVQASLIATNEGQVYENIDNAAGSLKPVKGKASTGIAIDSWFTYFYAESAWLSKTTETDFVEYKEKMYFTNGGILQQQIGATATTLGFAGPTSEPTAKPTYIGSDTISAAITRSSASNTTAGDIPLIDKQYYKLIANSTKDNLDYEFAIIAPEDSLAGTNVGQWVLTIDLPSAYFNSGDTVTIYRRYNGMYKEVGSAPWTGVPLNYTNSIFDIGENSDYPSILRSAISKKYIYAYTYYDTNTGMESQPSPLSKEFDIGTSGSVTILQLVNSSHANVTHIRLYRIGGDLPDFTLVTEIADPMSGSYTDNYTDIEIAGNHVLDTLDQGIAPTGLKYLTEAYAMLFGAVDDKLYFSVIGKPYAWNTYHFIDIDETITGIGALSNGLLVFTKYKTYMVTGNSFETFSIYLLSGNQGCLQHSTIKFVDNSLVWLSSDGICATTGGTITVISLTKIGKLSVTTVFNATIYDNVYYLSIGTASNYIIAFDFRYNKIVRMLDFGGTYLGTFKDKLYHIHTGYLHTLLLGSKESMTYLSPRYDEDVPYVKLYENVLVAFGDTAGESGTVIVYVDEVIVTTKALSGTKQINYLELIDVNHKTGNSIEFKVTGTVEILELAYIAYTRDTITQSKTFYSTTEFKETVIVNNTPEIFNLLASSYKSDVLPISITNAKMFSNMFFTFIGDIEVDVIIAGAVAITYTLSSASLTTEETKIPSGVSRAYYIEFEYRVSNNSSKLYAIETKLLGRQT